jgi:DNA-binding CsgD family transcriptional regulator
MSTRDTSEVRRSTAMLEAVYAARSLGEFITRTLEALDEHLGIRHSALMLALSERPLPGHMAFAGTQHGLRPHVMEEYFERWGRFDALTGAAARAAYARDGHATVAGVYGQLEPSRRRYVDDFLHRTGDQDQLSFRLFGGGWTEAYLTLTGDPDPDQRQRRLMRALVPELTERLQRHLPRGLDGALTARESQVAELVALGFGNRDIAAIMQIEEDTVKKHVGHATTRLGLHGRTQLAVSWTRGERLELPAVGKARVAALRRG